MLNLYKSGAIIQNMEIITGILLGALALCFIGAMMTEKYEFPIMGILFVFCSFVAIQKDAGITDDMVMLLYVPIVAIGLFCIGAFFKANRW